MNSGTRGAYYARGLVEIEQCAAEEQQWAEHEVGEEHG
jgi:hypothetical protein